MIKHKYLIELEKIIVFNIKKTIKLLYFGSRAQQFDFGSEIK